MNSKPLLFKGSQNTTQTRLKHHSTSSTSRTFFSFFSFFFSEATPFASLSPFGLSTFASLLFNLFLTPKAIRLLLGLATDPSRSSALSSRPCQPPPSQPSPRLFQSLFQALNTPSWPSQQPPSAAPCEPSPSSRPRQQPAKFDRVKIDQESPRNWFRSSRISDFQPTLTLLELFASSPWNFELPNGLRNPDLSQRFRCSPRLKPFASPF